MNQLLLTHSGYSKVILDSMRKLLGRCSIVRLIIAMLINTMVGNSITTFAADLSVQQVKAFKSEWDEKIHALDSNVKPISADAQQLFAREIVQLRQEQLVHFSYAPFAYLLTDIQAIKSVLQAAAVDSRVEQGRADGAWASVPKLANGKMALEVDALNHLLMQVAQYDIQIHVMKCIDDLKSIKDDAQRTATVDRFFQVVTVFSYKVLRDRSADRVGLMSALRALLKNQKPASVVSQIEEISIQNINDPNLNWHPTLRSLAAKFYGKSIKETETRKIPLTGQFATSRERDEGTSEAGWLNYFPDLNNGQYGLGKSHLPDLIRFQKLLISSTEVVANLKSLDVRIQQLRQSNPKLSAAEALNQALTEKEAEHGFSTAKIIPLGVLPSKLFLTLPAQGYVVQDIGASLDHGEFTHRLQWRSMMDSFDKERQQKKLTWKHTPYELFTLIGQRDLDAAIADQDRPEWDRGNSIWVHLMDKLGVSEIGGFRHADGMQQYFLDQDTARKKNEPTELPFIAEGVRERFQVQLDGVLKYQKLLADFRAAPVDQQKSIAAKLPVDLSSSPNTVAFDLFMHEYRIMRTSDGSYKLWDPAQPDLPLLIGATDKKVSPEVVERTRLESREKFGIITPEQSNRLAKLRKAKQ